MKIDSQVKKYLEGQILSNGKYFLIDRMPIISRNELLVKLAKNRRVLHLGCADHISLIKKKREKGKYLHDLLSKSAEYLVGIDINSEALAKMNSFGIKNLFHVEELPRHYTFDILMVPDVIEHVGNMEKFLDGLKKHRAETIVITTPNAYRILNRISFRKELANTDHRYWFSPYTLAKTLSENGLEIDKFYYTDQLLLWQPIKSFLKWRYPFCRDGLAVVAKQREA